ncbi:MAG: hypothetical protein R6U96_19255 [Promethearchaeia archaeon]
MLKKSFQENWKVEIPTAVLTCTILKCRNKEYIVFGGHDRYLYFGELKNEDLMISDDIEFDGWIRCIYPIDINNDGCQELLVGSGDGSFLVFQFDPEKHKLQGIMRYQAKGKITCCIAGDIYRNGNIELIFGSEDKALRIFDGLDSEKPRETLYYDSWITVCTLGYIQRPKDRKALYSLIVGNKNGIIQAITIEKEMPNIIWQKNVSSQINAVQIGDVTNDGMNDILLATNDGTLKILDAEANLINEIELPKSRAVSLLINDIDADNINEILVGCADGDFMVYQNKNPNSINFEIKWNKKVKASIKDITCSLDKRNDQMNLVFGGYERTLRCLSDMDYKQLPNVEFPDKMKLPKKPKRDEETPRKIKFEKVHTNMREYLIDIFEEYDVFLSLDGLKEELEKLGYSPSQISENLDRLKEQNVIKYEKLKIPVWTYAGGPEQTQRIEEESVTKPEVSRKKSESGKDLKSTKEMTAEPLRTEKEEKKESKKTERAEKSKVPADPNKKSKKLKEAIPDEKSNIQDVILTYLRKEGPVSSKDVLIEEIEAMGHSEDDIGVHIDKLNDTDKINYFRTKPRGWNIVE